MSEPGELRHRLTLEAPVETPDGAGGVTRAYQPVATLWGTLAPVAARPAVEADKAGAVVTHRIVLRFRADVTVQHRLRAGARVFRILALRDRDERRRFLEIDAQERID